MGQRLQILVEGKDLDLEPDAHDKFYITRQVNDLRNLETRNADFTKQIDIPATLSNIAKLGEPQSVGLIAVPLQPLKRLQAEIRLDGVSIAPNAQLLITESDNDSFKGQLLFGNFSFFDAMGERTLSQIDWSDLDFDFTPAQVAARVDNDTGLVTAIADWIKTKEYSEGLAKEPPPIANLDRNDWNRAVSTRESGFFLYFREILQRIVDDALPGFSLDEGTAVDFDAYNQAALACPVKQFTPDATAAEDPLFAQVNRVSADGTQNYDGNGTGGAPFRVIWPTVDADPDLIWDAGNNEFDTPLPPFGLFQFNLRVDMLGQFIEENGTPDSFARLMSDRGGVLTVLDEFNLTTGSPGLPIVFTFSLTRSFWFAVENEKFYVELSLGDGPGGNGDQYNHSGNDANANRFSIAEAGQVVPLEISVAEWIPEMTQADFVTGLFKMFNIIPFLDTNLNTLFLKRWDRIPQSEEQNLSDQLDIGLSQNNTRVETFFSRYGQINNFIYAPDGTLLNTGTGDAVVNFQSEILQPETDLIVLPFAASDDSPYFLFTERTEGALVNVPDFKKEAFTGSGANVDTGVDSFLITFDDQPGVRRGDYIRLAGITANGSTYQPNLITSIENDGLNARVATAFNISTVTAVDWKAWRIEEEETDAPRIAMIKQDDASLVSDMYIVNGIDSDTETLTPGVDTWKEAKFLDGIRFGAPGGLVENHYERMIESLENPLLIKTFMRFDPVQFEALDFFRPVFLSPFNSSFYLNKIDQYKVGQLTRVELVRIGKIF